MAADPYSPYVDRTGGSTGWGANPTMKRGPQNFPVLAPFKPYSPVVASAPGLTTLARTVNRLRTTPAPAAAAADAGTGNAGRGADSSGATIQGIKGIEGIPTLGGVTGDVTVGLPPPPPPDVSSPPPTDQPGGQPPPDQGGNPPPTPDTSQAGGAYQASLVARLRDAGAKKNSRGPQY